MIPKPKHTPTTLSASASARRMIPWNTSPDTSSGRVSRLWILNARKSVTAATITAASTTRRAVWRENPRLELPGTCDPNPAGRSGVATAALVLSPAFSTPCRTVTKGPERPAGRCGCRSLPSRPRRGSLPRSPRRRPGEPGGRIRRSSAGFRSPEPRQFHAKVRHGRTRVGSRKPEPSPAAC